MTKKKARKSAAKKATVASSDAMGGIAALFAAASADMGDEFVLSDLQALMTSLSSPMTSDGLSEEQAVARAEAQELAFEAMETGDATEARQLAQRALGLDPDCVDALVLLADLDAQTPRDRIERLQQAVVAGERWLGAEYIRENTGSFWALLDTRPYMRAMAGLAVALSSEGLTPETIATFTRMLELNPNDNQGVRDLLLGLYLETGDSEGAKRLLQQFKNDASATFAWGRVLERRLAGDQKGAGEALKKARRTNPHVELFLTAQKPLPEDLPAMYSPGSQEEAILSLDCLSAAWGAHPAATSWLLDELMAGKKPSASGKRGAKKSARADRLQ